MPTRSANRNVRLADIPGAGEETGSRSLRRGLAILDAICSGPADGLRVSEICTACALERATVHRLIDTLMETGYIMRSGRFRYVPTHHTAIIAHSAIFPPAQADIAARLQPVLAQVSAACGDASFAVMREGQSISSCVTRHIGTYPVQILSVQVGTRQPLGVGAAGLALLAALPVAETNRVIRHQVQSGVLDNYGGMTGERLKLLVRAARERGYAVVGNHAAKGALGVGVAVRDQSGTPIAAISVAAEISRMTKRHQSDIVAAMHEALKVEFPASADMAKG